MESFSDWLYIILLVIAGVSGVLSSARKKKRSVPMTSEPEEEEEEEDTFSEESRQEGKSIWEIWEDLHKEKRVQPQQQPKPKQAKPQVKKTPAYTPLAQIENPEEEAFPAADSLRDTDELKKAVIYSEILHRKY